MRVLFFAQLKDVTGCAEISLEPAAPLSSEALWGVLLERFPGLQAHRPSLRLARNWEYVGPETVFTLGDEVALIPPVSGG